jgi:hypothetical protein
MPPPITAHRKRASELFTVLRYQGEKRRWLRNTQIRLTGNFTKEVHGGRVGFTRKARADVGDFALAFLVHRNGTGLTAHIREPRERPCFVPGTFYFSPLRAQNCGGFDYLREQINARPQQGHSHCSFSEFSTANGNELFSQPIAEPGAAPEAGVHRICSARFFLLTWDVNSHLIRIRTLNRLLVY